MYRKKLDFFFKHLFKLVSFASALALGAILVFVLVQGTSPFIFPTAPDIRIVTERIADLTVNGVEYHDHSGFIHIPKDTQTVSLTFINRGEEQKVVFTINRDGKTQDEIINFTKYDEEKLTKPESFVYSLSYPGNIIGLEQKIHIIIPEPPYSAGDFLFGLDWQPSRFKVYGIFPMILGTLLVSFGAILLGLPMALLCSLFLAEFLSEKLAGILRSGIEILAGIPSVVFGFFGLMVVVPAVKQIFQVPSGNSLLSAILVLAIMILPTVVAISETSLRAVPQSYREASLSLGASKMQTAWFVVLPHAQSGVIAGIILGISRAVGETMAVILVAGNSSQIVRSPLDSVRTLTSTIALEMGYASGRHSEMLFSIGVTLFILILGLNSIILWMRRKTEAH